MNAPLIAFDNVDVRLDGQPVLSDVSWRLHKAEHWAVLGGNGAGKTTFLKLIRGEISPVPRKGGRIYRLGGPQRTAVGIKEQMPLVSPEVQDRYLQLEWKRRVDEVICSGFGGADYLYGRPSVPQREVAARLAAQFGVDHLWRRDVQQLSTGELRRVLIVRALVRRPPVLLLDEACDGLDGPARRLLLNALNDIANAGTQIIYTTHRTEEFIPALTHALLLERGRISWKGAARGNCKLKIENFQFPIFNSQGCGHTLAPAAARSGGGKPLISLAGAKVFLQRKRVLCDISWELRPGENWAVLGANGSGKTTFLRLICGDVHPALGGLVKRFELTPRHTLWDIRRRIGFVSPALQANYRAPASVEAGRVATPLATVEGVADASGVASLPTSGAQLTGAQVIASGFFSSIGLVRGVSEKQQQRVDELVEEFAAKRLAATAASKMSYGELRKILLLRALVHKPAVVVCDEPFDGLDPEAKEALRAALDGVAGNGTRLITVTHHIEDLPQSTTHALVLEKGRIVCQGEWKRVRDHPAVRSLFDHE